MFEALKCAGSSKAGVPKGAAANDWVPKGGDQNGGEPKISSFFQSPATIFILSFTLGNAGTLEPRSVGKWGSSRGMSVVF